MGHRVQLHGGKCMTPHGHGYAADITVAGPIGREGFVLDFGAIKERVGGWIDEALDHTTAYERGDLLMEAFSKLNDELGLKPFFVMDHAPTAERLAELIAAKAVELLEEIDVVSVVVFETPKCSAEWTSCTR